MYLYILEFIMDTAFDSVCLKSKVHISVTSMMDVVLCRDKCLNIHTHP